MNERSLTERLYVPNVEDWLEVSSKNYRSERTLTVKKLERGVILPARPVADDPFKCNGGVCDAELNFIDGHNDVIDNPWSGHYVLREAYDVKPDEIIESDDEVIYGGAMIYHFGHFITETLSRMWYVLQHPEAKQKIIFVVIQVNAMQIPRPWVNKLFDLLGITDEQILVVSRPIRFRSVIVPEQSLYFRASYTEEFLMPYRAILERIRPSAARKIFLSRSRDVLSMVHLSNQGYFEQFYHERGFIVVYPEKLSIIEQILLVAGADEIVTYAGTLSHWALFCKPGTKFTILTRVNDVSDFKQTMVRQSLINEATGVDWNIVNVARNFLFAAHGLGECLIGSTEHWQKYVLDRFGEHVDADEAIPQEIIDNYIERWCKFYSSEATLPYRVQTINHLRFENKSLKINLESGHPALCCQTYLDQVGWLPTSLEGEICGRSLVDSSIRAFRAYFIEPFCDVRYAVCYPDAGWTKPVSNGETAGVVETDTAICGLSMRLESTEFDIAWRLHVFGGNWSTWARNGEIVSCNYALNAVQIKVIPRGVSMKGAV